MKSFLTSVALCALLSSCAGAPAFADGWPVADMNRTIDQTNFQVNDGCSGTLIDTENRYILTANHCVNDQYETIEREKIDDEGVITKEKVRRLRDGTVTQFTFQGSENIASVSYRVKVIAVDRRVDLAVLQVRGALLAVPAAKLSCTNPVRGDQIYTVGNPKMLYASVTTGIVSSFQRDYSSIKFGESEQAKEPLMQVSGGVVGGNSGGAVYNVRGEIVGVPVIANTVNEVIGFAVPADAIKKFLVENKLGAIFEARCK
jgi:S1-C subfamily serine protease